MQGPSLPPASSGGLHANQLSSRLQPDFSFPVKSRPAEAGGKVEEAGQPIQRKGILLRFFSFPSSCFDRANMPQSATFP